jgi:hypothetical protein
MGLNAAIKLFFIEVMRLPKPTGQLLMQGCSKRRVRRIKPSLSRRCGFQNQRQRGFRGQSQAFITSSAWPQDFLAQRYRVGQPRG